MKKLLTILFIGLTLALHSSTITVYRVNNSTGYREFAVQADAQAYATSIGSSVQTIVKNVTPPTYPLRDSVIAIANSTVGVRIDQLTANQVRALFAIILYKNGAIVEGTLKIDSLNHWLLPPSQ